MKTDKQIKKVKQVQQEKQVQQVRQERRNISDKRNSKRDMILAAALDLFSLKGYDATSIDEIGMALHMKGPAIYHYFKGKEGLLDGLLEKAAEYYNAHFGSRDRIDQYPETFAEFAEISIQRLTFTVHDPMIKKVRKMMAMEQFRDERFARLATMHQLTGVMSLNEVFLQKLADEGKIVPCDPHLLAFEFTAPVSMLIQVIDREPEREEEMMGLIRQHMNHFVEKYSIS